jgi:CheY-like chemotaxis protein
LSLDSESITTQSMRRHAAGSRTFDGTRILVVDDDAESSRATAAVLAQAGATVRTAAGGREALRQVRKWHPRLVVSDLMMVEGDGYFLITQLRALPRGGTVPTVALSGATSPAHRERTRTAGFDAYLAKPVNGNELIAVLMHLWLASSPSRGGS